MARRLDLTLRALRALRDDGAAPAVAIQERVLLGGVHGVSAARYSINVLDGEARFLHTRLTALHRVRCSRDPVASLSIVFRGTRSSLIDLAAAAASTDPQPDSRHALSHHTRTPQAGAFAKPGTEGPGPLPPFVNMLKSIADYVDRAQAAVAAAAEPAAPVAAAPAAKGGKKRKAPAAAAAAEEEEEGAKGVGRLQPGVATAGIYCQQHSCSS